MSVGSHSFLKKKSNSPGEFENFRFEVGNETTRCNMAINQLIRENPKLYIPKTRNIYLFESNIWT